MILANKLFYAIILFDFVIYTIGFQLFRRSSFFPISKTKTTFFSLFFIQLFILFYVFTTSDGMKMVMGGAKIKTVSIYAVKKDGGIDRQKYKTISTVKEKRDKENLDKKYRDRVAHIDFLPSSWRLEKHVFKIGRKPLHFHIKSVVLYSKVLFFKIPIIDLDGGVLGRYLRSPNPGFNVLYQKDFLYNVPRDKIHPAWVVLPAHIKASIRLLEHKSNGFMFLCAILRAFFITIFIFTIYSIPALSKLSLSHAKGINRSVKSFLAYGFMSTLVVLIVISILALMSEVFLRWYFSGSNIFSTAEGQTYFHNKSWHRFLKEHNSQGYRGKEFNLKKASAFRVVVMGDSIAWGQGVLPYTKRFPEMAEKIIKERYPKLDIEIINVGYAGRNLPEYNRLMDYINELKPDYLLYQWYINDIDISMDLLAFFAPALLPVYDWHTYLIQNSILYYLLQRAWNQFRKSIGVQKSYNEYLLDRYGDEDSEFSIEARDEFKTLLDRIQSEKIPFGMVLFPSFASKTSDYPVGFLHERVISTLKDYSYKCLDLRDAFSVYDDRYLDLWANRFDPHPGALAHEVAAKEIVENFGALWEKMAQSNDKEKD